MSQESESDDSAASNAEVKSKGHSKQKVAVISGEKEKRAEQISSKDNSSPPNETHEDQKFIKRKDLPTDNARDAQSPTVEAKRKRKRKRHNEKKVEESVDIQPLADPHADNRISEKMASGMYFLKQRWPSVLFLVQRFVTHSNSTLTGVTGSLIKRNRSFSFGTC